MIMERVPHILSFVFGSWEGQRYKMAVVPAADEGSGSK
jgi:hypothetical protein